jgi:hypothetical protein
MNEGEFHIEATSERIGVTYPKGEKHVVSIDSLCEVIVETNDSGPWDADVWIVFRGRDDVCLIPQGAEGQDALWPFFKRLPGFDYDLFAEAMSCVEKKSFVCWRAKDS